MGDPSPTYQDLLREVEYSAKQAYAPSFEYPQQPQAPQTPPQSPQPLPPPQQQQPYVPPLPPPPSVMPIHKKKRGGVAWQYRHAILVAAVVLIMLAYGIPKLQASVASASTAVAVYKLSTMGMLLVAAASGGMYALASAYL